ncbi:putative NOC2 family protein [Neolecta irregularis DAH-3]|uniref:Putative NOC2 family protein n=1 Tax=Neolecta irregularis (strain DAH-3) TaxID=1198029 RepID=A0A1U7LWR4_NEOID|nr:putative NOC2 family protein [Neolecta irregularis DAH-3]|eukprot:OLL27120.1 putative NOC2 family protein [Neolecta irregularis DAH-3]
MGRPAKATKKFQKNKLPKALERRKAIKKTKQTHRAHDKKSTRSIKVDEQPVKANPVQGTTLESDDEIENLAQDHKQQLGRLQKKDPEFYQFLKDNEEDLLNFGNNEDEEDPEVEIGDSSEDEPLHHKAKPDNTKISQELLSLEQIERWRSLLVKDHSIKTMKKVAVAFKAAVHLNETEENIHKYQIDDPEGATILISYQADSVVFNQILMLSLVQIPESVIHHLPPSQKTGRVPTDSAKFKALSPVLKSHFSSILHLLPTLTDPITIKLVLSESEKLVPYMLSFRKFLRTFVKTILDLWSTSPHDSVRISSFLVTRKLSSVGDSGVRDSCMKLSYTALVKQSKHTTVHSLPQITLTKNSASELFGIDQSSAYTVAFGYIRQLAIHLRGSIHNKTKESHKAVYNWQYVHSLDFWSTVLSMHCEREQKAGRESLLKPLIYPLVQITLGAIRLRPTPQFFPLQFHLIRLLLRISKATGTYIPLTPHLFEIINSSEIRKKAKPSTQKPLDFEIAVRAPNAYLCGRVYQDGLVDQVIELFGEFYYLLSKSIAFPELVIPTIVQLKRYVKKSKNVKLNKFLLTIVEKLELHSTYIEGKRSKVEFSPEKVSEVERFLEGVDIDKLPLGKWVAVQREIKEEKRRLLREALKDEHDSNHDQVETEDETDLDEEHDDDDEEDNN